MATFQPGMLNIQEVEKTIQGGRLEIYLQKNLYYVLDSYLRIEIVQNILASIQV